MDANICANLLHQNRTDATKSRAIPKRFTLKPLKGEEVEQSNFSLVQTRIYLKFPARTNQSARQNPLFKDLSARCGHSDFDPQIWTGKLCLAARTGRRMALGTQTSQTAFISTKSTISDSHITACKICSDDEITSTHHDQITEQRFKVSDALIQRRGAGGTHRTSPFSWNVPDTHSLILDAVVAPDWRLISRPPPKAIKRGIPLIS